MSKENELALESRIKEPVSLGNLRDVIKEAKRLVEIR